MLLFLADFGMWAVSVTNTTYWPTADNRISAELNCTTVHCRAAIAQHSTQIEMMNSAVQWSAQFEVHMLQC